MPERRKKARRSMALPVTPASDLARCAPLAAPLIRLRSMGLLLLFRDSVPDLSSEFASDARRRWPDQNRAVS
jgi:hypothetical protein